jgi:hypothetical protein
MSTYSTSYSADLADTNEETTGLFKLQKNENRIYAT